MKKDAVNIRFNFYNNDFLDYNLSFWTDLLIVKKRDIFKKIYDVVAMNLYGTKADIQKVLRKNATSMFEVLSMSRSGDRFLINKGKDYDIEEVRGKYTTRITLAQKTEILLDQTVEKHPIVVLPANKRDLLEKIVFEKIREKIVSPLFPDLTNPRELAKELLCTKEVAEKVLENVKCQNIVGIKEKIALDGIQKYHEWVQYLYRRMVNDNNIINLDVVVFEGKEVLAYEVIVKEEEIRRYISEGLRSGKISISNQKNHYNYYSTFDDITSRYGKIFKKVIENYNEPLHKKGDIRPETKAVFSTLGMTPVGEQEDAIEAMQKSIKHQNRVNIVGEPGVGKTFMMSSTVYLDAVNNNRVLKALVLSPDHLVKSAWEKDIKAAFKDCKYHHINSLRDLIKYEKRGYLDDDQHRFFILKQNVAKNGYSERPMVIWDKHRKVFRCPDCNEIVKRRVRNENYGRYNDERKFIEVPVKFDHFNRQRFNNRKCKHCGTVLWGVNNKEAITFKEKFSNKTVPSSFIYTDMGFVPRDKRIIKKELEEVVNDHNKKKTKTTEKRIEHLRNIQLMLGGHKEEKNPVSPRKVPVAYYIKRKMKHRFTHLIIDEYHEFQSGTTSRTEAAALLIASVKKVVTGTGTMMNGYAKSRFYNDFMLFPEKMKKAGFTINDLEKYQVTFGVVEKRWRKDTKGKKIAISPRSKPGISPVIYPMFLQDSTVFISLEDLKKSLPELKHEIVEVEMTEELNQGKQELERAVTEATKGVTRLFKGMIPTLYAYLDMPTVEREIKDEKGNVIYRTKRLDNYDDKKMEALKRIIRKEKFQGKRTIVYTHYTSDGINDYIRRKLQEEGFNVTVLNKENEVSYSCDGTEKNVKKDTREAFIKEEVAKGTDVLVVNPTLVQTGTNLIDFCSIVYYQMSYVIYTMRQANRRTYRFGQTQDCTIYYLYYKDSFQADIASLMATKIVASEAIEGNMDSKGLEHITNDRTPEEELSKLFYEKMGFSA